MTKQSIFGRVTQLARANINAMIDSAEDPGKMLDQLIRDYTDNISEAEQAVAQTIGNLRMMEEDLAEDRKAAADWGGKAVASSKKADELRAQGDASGADKFDGLAKIAIGKQMDAERQVEEGSTQVATQTDVTEKLKTGLNEMKDKLVDLKKRRDNLVARAKTAQAQSQVQDAVKSIDILDPTSEVSRFEEKIRREEALVKGQAELAASTLDSQFTSLDTLAKDSEVDARLAALKAGKAHGAEAAAMSAKTAGASAPAGGAGGSSGAGASGSGSGSGSAASGSSGSGSSRPSPASMPQHNTDSQR